MVGTTDQSTRRKGVWDTLTTFGAALAQGTLMGAGAGGLIGGGIAGKAGNTAVKEVSKLDDFATLAAIELDDLSKLAYSRRRIVFDLSRSIADEETAGIQKAVKEIEAELGKDPATRIQKHLYVANAKPVDKPLVDAYMEQLIRLQGGRFDIEQEQWVELEE